jgi:hypothetical protein
VPSQTIPTESREPAPAGPAAPAGGEARAASAFAQADPDAVEEIVLATEQPAVPPAPGDAAVAGDGGPAAGPAMAGDRREPPRFDELEDDAELPEEFLPQTLRRRRTGLRWALVGAVVLALLVSAIHGRRGELMRDPSTAAWLGGIYEALGLSAQPTWEPGAFEFTASSAELDSRGRLVVTTSFVNGAGYPQPYPVLRVTLTDRWGQPLGRQDFGPAEYVVSYVADASAAPGEQIEGKVSMLSAYPEAEGFNLDLCLDRGDGSLACAMGD